MSKHGNELIMWLCEGLKWKGAWLVWETENRHSEVSDWEIEMSLDGQGGVK